MFTENCWVVAIVVVLISISITGWWLYLKPRLIPITGGIPKGGIVAFDISDGCPDGWKEFENAAGRTIIGIGTGDGLTKRKYRKTGGEETQALTPRELAPHRHDTLLGTQPKYSIWSQGKKKEAVFGIKSGQIETGMTSPVGQGESFDIMPPFIVLQYCEKL